MQKNNIKESARRSMLISGLYLTFEGDNFVMSGKEIKDGIRGDVVMTEFRKKRLCHKIPDGYTDNDVCNLVESIYYAFCEVSKEGIKNSLLNEFSQLLDKSLGLRGE